MNSNETINVGNIVNTSKQTLSVSVYLIVTKFFQREGK